jgi:hypothetical protein
MRRHAHANPLVWRRSDLVHELKSKSPSEWSQHLNSAWAILHGELGVVEETAFPVIFSSVSAAHACARVINRRIENIVEFETRNKLCKAFERIAKCAKRAPAKLRRRLETGGPLDLSSPQIAFPSSYADEAQTVEFDIAVMATPDMPEQHRLAIAVVRGLGEGAGTRDGATAIVEPVSRDVPAGTLSHEDFHPP